LGVTNAAATSSELRLREMSLPRVAKAQPWAGIGERFQRYSFSDKFSRKLAIPN
jgi:hypothetical protein